MTGLESTSSHNGRPAAPELEVDVVGARHEPYAAAPTVVFSLRARDASEREIYTVALSMQVLVDPTGRGYDEETRHELFDLFGPTEELAQNLQSLVWARADVMTPSFTGELTLDVPIACTYDLEVASAKYFASLRDGVAPLDFHFNGTVFYRADAGNLQIVKVPWSCTARYRMRVDVWRQAVNARFAHSGWIRLHEDTLAGLRRRKAERGLPSFDDVVLELLEGSR